MIVLLFVLIELATIEGNERPSNTEQQQPITLQKLNHYVNFHPDKTTDHEIKHDFNALPTKTFLSNLHSNAEIDDDYEYDNNSGELMKTSHQIVFRPLFRYKQMMEERKQREETRRRIFEMQRVFSENGSNYLIRYDENYNVYLCSPEGCHPLTLNDVNILPTIPPNNALSNKITPGTNPYTHYPNSFTGFLHS